MPARRVVLLALSMFAAVLFADQAVKQWVLGHLPQGARATTDWGLSLWHLRNPGFMLGAFGAEQGRSIAFLLGAVGALGALALVLSSRPLRDTTRMGLALLAAGALGNGVDRLIHGEVIDYLVLSGSTLGAQSLVINLADVAILVSAALLLPASLRPSTSPASPARKFKMS